VSWGPLAGVSNPQIAQPQLSPSVTTTYGVALDYGFCRATDSIRVTVADSAELECTKVFFPNAFTPNGDNLNEDWGMSNIVFLGKFVRLEVFDRWGGKVFESFDEAMRWDGTHNGAEVDPGVFAYVFTFLCEETEQYKTGNVMLIR